MFFVSNSNEINNIKEISPKLIANPFYTINNNNNKFIYFIS